MSADPRKRQKKLERRAAKRKSKQQLLVKDAGAGLAQRQLSDGELRMVSFLNPQSLGENPPPHAK